MLWKLFADFSSQMKTRRCQENPTESADLYSALIRIASLMPVTSGLSTVIRLNIRGCAYLCKGAIVSFQFPVFSLEFCWLLQYITLKVKQDLSWFLHYPQYWHGCTDYYIYMLKMAKKTTTWITRKLINETNLAVSANINILVPTQSL